MKHVKKSFFSIIVWLGLSSFGLINNSTILQSNQNIVSIDSLNRMQGMQQLPMSAPIKEVQKKDINSQQEEEKSESTSITNQIGYFILLGLKTIVTFALKLFSL
ncbi:MAG: hypothetical protein RJA76_962 [Bacteroidota bacterium]|jgi:hypothetical protein